MNNAFLKILLYPLSIVYSIVVWVRNKMFDLNIFHSVEFKLPVISIGNITVGGTGKTPHTEYIIRLLKENYKLAILSRGYKRKTSGFRIAGENSNFEEIGDEPLQIKNKFKDIIVAVDGNRVRGIKGILQKEPTTDIILLDDAFQHRWVTPGISILLVDFNQPVFEDTMLPAGRLREPVSERKRADIIIVSKAPFQLSAMEKRLLMMKLEAKPSQSVYFTGIRYSMPKAVFSDIDAVFIPFDKPTLSVLLVTGIANPDPLVEELDSRYAIFKHIRYPDHYSFLNSDIQHIQDVFDSMPGSEKVILTTEKDSTRFLNFEYQVKNRERWHYIPIEIEFHQGDAELFNRQILHYVINNSRNSLLYKK